MAVGKILNTATDKIVDANKKQNTIGTKQLNIVAELSLLINDEIVK